MLKNNLERRQSELIEAMRFPLIVLVVFIHVLPEKLLPIEMNYSGMNIYHIISESFSHIIGRIAVPCFFLFSGYYFFRKLEKWNFDYYSSQLLKRYKTLVIPYFLWNALIIMAICIKQYVFSLLSLEVKEDGIFAVHNQSLYELFWVGPVNFPLWYLRDLICMSLLTPLFYYLFRFLRVYGVLIGIVLYLTTIEIHLPGLSMTAFMYFGLGAYWGIYKKNILEFCLRFKLICGVGALFFLGCSVYNNGYEISEYFTRPFVLLGVITAINIMNWVIQHEIWKKRLCDLSVTVFFIYAVHEIYIINWIKGLFARLFVEETGGRLLVSYISIPVITISICLMLYYLLNRTMPRMLAFMIGGRVKNELREVANE